MLKKNFWRKKYECYKRSIYSCQPNEKYLAVLSGQIKQQKENSANRINQMEGCTTITLDGFEQHRTSTSVGD